MKLRIKVAAGVSAGFVWGMLAWGWPWVLIALSLGYPIITLWHSSGVIR